MADTGEEEDDLHADETATVVCPGRKVRVGCLWNEAAGEGLEGILEEVVPHRGPEA